MNLLYAVFEETWLLCKIAAMSYIQVFLYVLTVGTLSTKHWSYMAGC
jgi:hypothetical protein